MTKKLKIFKDACTQKYISRPILFVKLYIILYIDSLRSLQYETSVELVISRCSI